ncbi:alpha-amylase [Reichenbachiella faecimaris]|uniref:Alpha-amylase n=1 Tax=Reichenbachiella faecimaris TaxID=692418 RepID=A0A1W2GEX4_REIFA|nr:T9SS type A sorting domain-containing protein [Reichenbachiella faecimaris]SMD35220.1 alpha-amylase [Reichenbachiella faecimaris]
MIKKLTLTIFCTFLFATASQAQDDVMMQAFYWNLPVDETNLDGDWWDNLADKSTYLKNAGFTGLWLPSPSKGNWGIVDMGYGIYDHYDLGNYNQKGSTETRFGSRSELEAMIADMHDTSGGQPKIEVYADIILNHVYSSDEDEEVNPAVKAYTFAEAYTNGSQHVPYPSNEIKWVIPNAGTGDYYIKIKGFEMDWGSYDSRGYEVTIDWTGSGDNTTYTWESEPNGGNGDTDVFPGSGQIMRGFIGSSSDIDEYQVTLTSAHDIVIKLKAIDNTNGWNWGNQNHGLYPAEVWYNGNNLASTTLEARTNTGISYVTHTGTGEPNHSWNYSHFHPVDGNDWLGDWGGDEIIPNTKGFGNDFNTYSAVVQDRFEDWGEWLSNEIGFDGYRLDFVRGFQADYAADWVNSLPLLNGNQRFIVGEYWGSDSRINDWVNDLAADGADADGFDFPLKSSLTDMCNGTNSYDMRWLNNAGMVRNGNGHALPGTSVVTWLDNHDTGKEHDKWVTKDWKMGYAYILTHEGRPCVFYPHYYNVTLVDNHDSNTTVTSPASLQEDINKLMFVRSTYLGGSLEVLSDIGNPYPSGDAADVYVARRAGNGTKDGAIVVINNSNSTKGLWVDITPSGWSNWDNTVLVNAFDNGQTTQVYGSGRAWVEAPARGYAVYVKQGEYVAYSAPSARTVDLGFEGKLDNKLAFNVSEIFPNPVVNGFSNLEVDLPDDGTVWIEIIDLWGRTERQIEVQKSAGHHTIQLDVQNLRTGYYLYKFAYRDHVTQTKPFLVKN